MVAVTEREKLERAGTLHWFHWAVVLLSLILTFLAWFFSSSQVDEKRALQFEREADQVTELVLERMRKYEDALWGGVAFVRTLGDEVGYDEWLHYSQNIRIELKYPGINGIGVIQALRQEDLPSYLAYQRKRRPDYQIHPPHDGSEYYPITYIEPLKGNEKAVGLDMAHETNRFTAAKKARDTGDARITGPIVLVQDAGQTPGFLFYAPYYEGGVYESVEERQQHFLGMVYAPFVVKRLMEGVLAKQRRHVALRIADEQDILYDELVPSEADFDAEPQFKKSVKIALYGRNWKFDIWSAKSFRAAASSSQPLTILMGGIIIDALLIGLFISISRSNRQALAYADAMNSELQFKTVHLEKSNQDLQRFAHAASHDLQEPLRAVQGYAQMLAKRYQGKLDDQADLFIAKIGDGVGRMKTLITGLLDYSRIGAQDVVFEEFDVADAVDDACKNLEFTIGEFEAEIVVDTLPRIGADQAQLAQLFQNLIANAIKFRGDERPRIEIGAARIDDTLRVAGRNLPDGWLFSVADNGIGIEAQYFETIFVIFKRLHSRSHSEGTGLGLAMCQNIIDRYGGQIWVESQPGKGATFSFDIPD